jgi:hypothetical protein
MGFTFNFLMMQRIIILAILAISCSISLRAQGPTDHVYMIKKEVCVEVTYGQSTWNEYWEGQKLRGTNFGTFKHQELRASMAYGITDRVNALITLPWMRNSLEISPVQPQRGIQDLSLGAKWMILGTPRTDNGFKLAAVGMVSLPVGGYYFDMMPLALGLGSTQATVRGLASWQAKMGIYTLGYGSYTMRSNVKLDRDYYYTDRPHYTNEVVMPNMVDAGASLGFRNEKLRIELTYAMMNTLGGADIRVDDMPFVSNNFDAGMASAMAQYNIPMIDGLKLMAAYSKTVSGRNMGQADGWKAGFQFAFMATKPKTEETTTN